MGFSAPAKASSFTEPEAKEALKLMGFEVVTWGQSKTNYLNSPLEPQARSEKLHCWKSKKIKGVPKPPGYSYVPSWMTDRNEAIPANEHWQQNAQFDILSSQIILSVNGENTLNDIVQLVSENLKVSTDEAENFVITVFSRLFESSR
jgi:hypothetical protein